MKHKSTHNLNEDEMRVELRRARNKCVWIKKRNGEITREIRRLEKLRRELWLREEHYRLRMETISKALTPVKVVKAKRRPKKNHCPSTSQLIDQLMSQWDKMSDEQKEQLRNLQ